MNFSVDKGELTHASSLYQRRRFGDCLKVLLAIMIKCDTGAMVMLWAGNCLAQLGKNDLALSFFQRSIEVTQTAQCKILALESAVKISFNEKKLERAAIYAQQLKELRPSNAIAAVAESEFRIQQFLVNKATLLYLEGVLVDNAGAPGYCYVKYQLARVCIMLGERERGLNALGELAVAEEKLASYCYQYPAVYMAVLQSRAQRTTPGPNGFAEQATNAQLLEAYQQMKSTVILPQATQALYSLLLNETTNETVAQAVNGPCGFLAGLYWAVNSNGVAIRSEEQVLKSLNDLRSRFSYLLKGSEPWLFQLVTRYNDDYYLGILAQSLGPAFHNAALLVRDETLKYELFVSALYLTSERTVGVEALCGLREEIARKQADSAILSELCSPRTGNFETLLALGQLIQEPLLIQNVYVAALGLPISRDHIAAAMYPALPASLLLRRKSYEDFVGTQSGQMIFLLTQRLNEADFDALTKLCEDCRQVHLFSDPWVLLLQAFSHCKKLSYVSAQRWLGQAASSLQTQYILRDEKTAARLRLKVQEEAEKAQQLLYKAFKAAGRSAILLGNCLLLLITTLLAEQNVDPDQYGFALSLYSQVIGECPEKMREKLSHAMALLALKQQRLEDAGRFGQSVEDSPSGVALKLRIAVELGLREKVLALAQGLENSPLLQEYPGLKTALYQADKKMKLGLNGLEVPSAEILQDGEELRYRAKVPDQARAPGPRRGPLEDEVFRNSFGTGVK